MGLDSIMMGALGFKVFGLAVNKRRKNEDENFFAYPARPLVYQNNNPFLLSGVNLIFISSSKS